jgi:uroporphyrinogen decarboxylase
MCRTPELACEVTLQPLNRFPQLDAVIIFSDILIIPQAMGMVVKMVPGRGPVFPNPLVTPADLERLTFNPDIEATLGYLFDAINLTRRTVKGQVPVIGFAGGPWTLMAYMVEGGGSKTFAKAKRWLFAHPEAAHRLLSGLSDIIAALLIGEYQAGAQYLQVFESWSGELSEADFSEFVLPYLTKIAARVKEAVPATSDGGPPLVVFAKGAHYALEALSSSTAFDVVGLDWTITPSAAVSRIRGRKAVQGNLDPCVLYGSPDFIKKRVADMLQGFGAHTPMVANLGHGMHPTHTPEHLGAFFDAVHSVSAQMKAGQ